MESMEMAKAAACISAALVMGIGSLGTSLGQGLIGARGVEAIGKYAENAGAIRGTMFLALGVAETTAIYCAIVAGVLLSFASSW